MARGCLPGDPWREGRGAAISGAPKQDVQAGTGTPQAVLGAPAEVWAGAGTPGEPFCLGTVVLQWDRGAMLCGGFPLCRSSSVVDAGQALLHGEAGGDGVGLESPHCLQAAGHRALRAS